MNRQSPSFPVELWQPIVDQSVDATVVLNTQGKVAYWNRAAEHLFGYVAADALGQPLVTLVTPKRFQRLAAQELNDEFLQAANPQGQIIECLARCRGNVEYWVECSLSCVTIEEQRWVLAIYRDAHLRKTREQRLKRQAITDALSGLANRGEFQSVLEANLDRELSMAILDIDQFKSVNDTYGHPVGDAGICFVSHQLRRYLKDALCLGRLGGDEFGVIIGTADRDHLVAIFEHLRQTIADGFSQTSGGFTVSVGLVISSQPGTSSRELWTLADNALYRAKTQGRNRVEVSLLGSQHGT